MSRGPSSWFKAVLKVKVLPSCFILKIHLPNIEDSISQNLIQWLCDPLLSTNCHVRLIILTADPLNKFRSHSSHTNCFFFGKNNYHVQGRLLYKMENLLNIQKLPRWMTYRNCSCFGSNNLINDAIHTFISSPLLKPFTHCPSIHHLRQTFLLLIWFLHRAALTYSLCQDIAHQMKLNSFIICLVGW